MNTKQRLLIMALIPVLLCPVATADGGPAAASFDPPPHPFRASQIQRVAIGGDLYVERLSGLAAFAHLQNLRSKHPDAFERSSRSLRERGFQPTDKVYVERTVRLASNATSPGKLRFAQDYSESNADGEIMFWSWSNGDDNTWEGQIYVEIYSNGDASMWDGQIDASNEDHEWIFYQLTWEKPEEEIQKVGERREGGLNRPRPAPESFIPAVLSPETRNMLTPYTTASWIDWAKCWRQGVVGGCSGAAIGCIATNGGWPGCWGAVCVGAQVTAAIVCY